MIALLMNCVLGAQTPSIAEQTLLRIVRLRRYSSIPGPSKMTSMRVDFAFFPKQGLDTTLQQQQYHLLNVQL